MKAQSWIFLVIGVFFAFVGVTAVRHADAATWHFSHNLYRNETNTDVSSLQTYLAGQGFFNYPTSTGYFGLITFTGVKEWQAANCIPSTGYFGPISRGFVSGGSSLCVASVASTTILNTTTPSISTDPQPSLSPTTTFITTTVLPPSKWEGGVTATPPPPAPPISVSVSAIGTTTLVSGDDTIFTAMVNNSTNQSVNWSAVLGNIDALGNYSSPTVYATTTDTITAQSVADASKSGSMTVTIDPQPITISIIPTSTTMLSAASTSFAAVVSHASTTAVTWSALVGTINASGTYTAPTLSTSTIFATDTVTAVSVANNLVIATASVTITNGITDEWKLDEGSGTIALDSIGSHNGTWNGTQSSPSSTYYGAKRPSSTLAFSGDFNGVDDYINPNLTIDYTATSSFTWTVWMDLNSGINPDNVILGDRLDPNWVKLTQSSLEWYNGSLLSNSIPFNQWVNIAIVKSGSSFYYYQNGTLKTSASSTDVPGNLSFYIGSDPTSNGDGYTWGSLSDVRIYNTALTQSQIQTIYNGN